MVLSALASLACLEPIRKDDDAVTASAARALEDGSKSYAQLDAKALDHRKTRETAPKQRLNSLGGG